MEVTQITVSRGVTINIGDYQNARHEVSMTATLGEDEDVAAATEQLSV